MSSSTGLATDAMPDKDERIAELEKLLKEEERKSEEQDRILEELQRQNQDSTISEYLYNYHFYVYLKLDLPPLSYCSPGPVTPVEGRFYPKWLLPWGSFARQRHQRFDELRTACAQKRLFASELDAKGVGRHLRGHKPRYISDVALFEWCAVEHPVSLILASLGDEAGLRGRYPFSNIRMKSSGEMPGFGEATMTWKTRPGGFGIRTNLDGSTQYAFIFDYQPVHMFSVEHLEATLQKETLFDDVNARVVSKSGTREGKVKEDGEESIARALIRVFNLMIGYGVSYGYVAAGKSYVFLYYNPAEPRTLYYHLCVPESTVREAANEEDWPAQMYNTAVAQLASFCLESVQSEAAVGPSLEASMQVAKEQLATWGGQGYASESSETRTLVHHAYNRPTKQYCTQACLLGLKTGRHLASNCPNVRFHRGVNGGAQQHPIDITEFTLLVNERLRRDPYDYCEALSPWGMYGSIGVLFKLELAPYGYTFVGKGTTAALLSDLKHETNVYEKLRRLQGDVVPVHLGLVELPSGYILPGGLRAVHMMLMSWGGEMLTREGNSSGLSLEVQRSVQAVQNEGVYHDDVRDPNLLWNEELGRVMVIDFDHSDILMPPKHKAVSNLSEKGRKKGQKRVVANFPGKAKVLGSHPEAA